MRSKVIHQQLVVDIQRPKDVREVEHDPRALVLTALRDTPHDVGIGACENLKRASRGAGVLHNLEATFERMRCECRWCHFDRIEGLQLEGGRFY